MRRWQGRCLRRSGYWPPLIARWVQRQREEETTALSKLALNPNAPRVQLDELPGDCEAQTGAVVRARRRRINLRKFAKHELVVVARYPSAGVTHFDEQLVPVHAAARELDPDAPAVAGELDRIADEISEHVLELVAVRIHLREVISVQALDGEPLLGGKGFVQKLHLIHDLCDRKLGSDQTYLVARASDIRQDLVDHVDQLLAAVHDSGHACVLPRVQLAEHSFAQNFGVRDYRGERRAQVVRYVGEELRLQRIAGLELVDRLPCFFALRFKSREPLAQCRGIEAI